jgi:hypothetical protein
MTAARKTQGKELPIRGFLLHITHYDPKWCAAKDVEKPFDLEVGLEVVDAMAEAGLNLLVVDCADGLRYRSHPKLRRHYTVPMGALRELRRRAGQNGIDVAPKLNFAQSGVHCHNHWFRPYNNLFDNEEYWERAFRLVDEVIDAARSARYFHIGMDEDHWRGIRLYVKAVKTLRDGLKERGLQTLMWNDSACGWPAAEVHKEKSLAAEERGPKDVVHVVWDYARVRPAILKRVRERGLEVWGAPGRDPELVRRMRNALVRHGGSGILLTRWAPCTAANRDALLDQIRTAGPACR